MKPLILGVSLLAVPAAGAFEISLPGEAERAVVVYACSDRERRTAEYVNSGRNALALLEVDGEKRLFVNVVAASGARYVSGPLVWWTKGPEAMLTSETGEGEAITCREELE